MKKDNKILNLILPLITIACILLLWSVAAYSVGSKYILPTVPETVEALLLLLTEQKFYLAFSLTLLRSVIAFLLSFFIASVCAFLAHKNQKVERVVLTLMSILRALPTVSIVVLLLFWTNNQIAPVIVTMLVVMPTTYTHIKSAFDSIDKTTIEAGMVDGADRLQSFIEIEFPQIAPAVMSAIGSGLSLNFKLMVAAEVLSATVKSLGNMLNIANYNSEIASLLAMVIVAVLFGIIVEFVFNKISNKMSDWK